VRVGGTSLVGSTVTICGWVAKRRSTASTWPSSTCATARALSRSWSTARSTRARVRGARDGHGDQPAEGTVNENLATGEVELTDCTVEILAVAERRLSSSMTASTSTSRCVCATAFWTCAATRCSATCACARSSTAPARRDGRAGLLRGRDAAAVAPTPEGPRVCRSLAPAPGEFYVLPQSPRSPSSS